MVVVVQAVPVLESTARPTALPTPKPENSSNWPVVRFTRAIFGVQLAHIPACANTACLVVLSNASNGNWKSCEMDWREMRGPNVFAAMFELKTNETGLPSKVTCKAATLGVCWFTLISHSR